MDLKEQIEYWFELADDDLQVAESSFANNHFLWCLFLSHLAIEKSLKGLYVQNLNEIPPKIHDLVKLVKSLNISISESDYKFLFEMNRFNIEARYPEYKNNLKVITTKEFTDEKFQKSKEILEWLKSLKK